MGACCGKKEPEEESKDGMKILPWVHIYSSGVSLFDDLFNKAGDPLKTMVEMNNDVVRGIRDFRTAMDAADGTLGKCMRDMRGQMKESKVVLSVAQKEGQSDLDIDVKTDTMPETLQKGFRAAKHMMTRFTRVMKDSPQLLKELAELGQEVAEKMKGATDALKEAKISPLKIPSTLKNLKHNAGQVSGAPGIINQLIETIKTAITDITDAMKDADPLADEAQA